MPTVSLDEGPYLGLSWLLGVQSFLGGTRWTETEKQNVPSWPDGQTNMTNNTKEKKTGESQHLPPEEIGNTQHQRGFPLKHSLGGHCPVPQVRVTRWLELVPTSDSTTRQKAKPKNYTHKKKKEKRKRPWPGELKSHARSPCSGTRCCWVLKTPSWEGVKRQRN